MFNTVKTSEQPKHDRIYCFPQEAIKSAGSNE